MNALATLWRLRVPIVIVFAAALLLWALDRYVDAAVEGARQESAIAAHEADAIADDVAGQVAASHAATTDQENRDARKAAADSDDPLRAGLDQLRTGKTRDREASR